MKSMVKIVRTCNPPLLNQAATPHDHKGPETTSKRPQPTSKRPETTSKRPQITRK